MDVSLERTFRRTQWQAANRGVSGARVGRCAVGLGNPRVSLDALCCLDWRRKHLVGRVRRRCAVVGLRGVCHGGRALLLGLATSVYPWMLDSHYNRIRNRVFIGIKRKYDCVFAFY